MIKVYQERNKGQVEFFIYANGKRVRVSQAWIIREERNGQTITMIDLDQRAKGLSQ